MYTVSMMIQVYESIYNNRKHLCLTGTWLAAVTLQVISDVTS